MFDSTRARVVFLPQISATVDGLANPDRLRARCLGCADRWIMRRRAHLPYCGPNRLPAVARVG